VIQHTAGVKKAIFKKKNTQMTTRYAHIPSPLGQILVLSDGDVLTGLYFIGQKHMPEIQAACSNNPELDLFITTSKQLQEYFEGTRKFFDIPYRFDGGTPFQKSVWQEIAKIDYGHAESYSGLAKAIGSGRAVRAVGGAVGRNPLTLIVPCHRVFGLDGSFTGYAGGLDRKKALALLEHQKFATIISRGMGSLE
jgi:methylated-DNA-[protein]-cysteine S-methyltransferase